MPAHERTILQSLIKDSNYLKYRLAISIVAALLTFILTSHLLPHLTSDNSIYNVNLNEIKQELDNVYTEPLPSSIKWPLPTYTWRKPEELSATAPRDNGDTDALGKMMDDDETILNDDVAVCAREFGKLRQGSGLLDTESKHGDGSEKKDGVEEGKQMDEIWKRIRKECWYIIPQKAWKRLTLDKKGESEVRKNILKVNIRAAPNEL